MDNSTINQLLDILDTIVKIGLGALISGVSTYYITSIKHANDMEKEVRNRKLNTIEGAAKHIDRYINAFSTFISAVDSVSRADLDRSSIDIKDPDDSDVWEFIYEHNDLLWDAWDEKSFAISKLQLLGLTDVADILQDLTSLENEVRDLVIKKRIIPDTDTASEWQSLIKSVKYNFYKVLSVHYNA